MALLFTPTEPSRSVPLVRVAPRSGTLAIHEGKTGALHVFGPDGRRSLLCLPKWASVRNQPCDRIDVDAKGQLHAFSDDWHLWFNPQGEEMGFEKSDTSFDRSAQLYFLPSGATWSVELDRLTLHREGEEDLVVVRSAVGRWFQDLDSAAVASDGVLAVIDRGNGGMANHRDPQTVLQLFEPDGRPRATLPFPSLEFRPPLAAKPGECAVLRRSLNELAVLPMDGSRTGRAPLPADTPEPRAITYSPDGTELWLVDRELVLHRFELRWH